MTRRGIFPAIVVILLLSGCAGADHSGTRWKIPAEADVPGWKFRSAPLHYDRSNIVLYLKDRKNTYAEYGFRELTVARYIRVDDENAGLTLEFFLMGSDLNAFGIFSRERGQAVLAGHPPLNRLGVDSKRCYAGEHFLACRGGPYYWKLYPSGPGKIPPGDIRAFLSTVNRQVPSAGNPLPSPCRELAEKGEIDHIVYYPAAFDGVTGLENVYSGIMPLRGRDSVVVYAFREDSAAALREFMGLVNNEANRFILKSTAPYQSAFRVRDDGKYTILGQSGRWLLGVVGAGSLEQGEAVMGELVSLAGKCGLNSR
ncbi:MAG TPA: hypothetical protein ENN21_06705 [Spirochaetes bacterium]|nr:hypothetical protein [Spirochaetota bacterium]